jgi:hypothetical protein
MVCILLGDVEHHPHTMTPLLPLLQNLPYTSKNPGHGVRTPYRAETHASASPDGSRIIFASTWHNTDSLIGAYVIELCGSHD